MPAALLRPSPIAHDWNMSKPPTAVALGALAFALAILGCGGSDSTEATSKTATPTPAATVDDAQVEQDIKDSLSTSAAHDAAEADMPR
jgi:hypothetical protein